VDFYGENEIGPDEMYVKPIVTFPRFRVVEEGQLPTEEDPEAVEAQRQAEDQAQVDDFNYRLRINLGEVGGGLRSVGRRQQSPRKPAEGWSIVVKPYGKPACRFTRSPKVWL
jgi:hypothetical protein